MDPERGLFNHRETSTLASLLVHWILPSMVHSDFSDWDGGSKSLFGIMRVVYRHGGCRGHGGSKSLFGVM